MRVVFRVTCIFKTQFAAFWRKIRQILPKFNSISNKLAAVNKAGENINSLAKFFFSLTLF